MSNSSVVSLETSTSLTVCALAVPGSLQPLGIMLWLPEANPVLLGSMRLLMPL